jgi:hypothetical protein
MSTSDRSHRDSNELVDADDLADPQIEAPAPEPVVANAAAEQAAAVQRQASGESEESDTESIHRRVFTGDLPTPPPPPRTFTVGGPDDGTPRGAPPPAGDDDPEPGNAADAWSRRRGPPPPVAAGFAGQDSWAARPDAAGATAAHASAHGPPWARPPDREMIEPPPVEETPWARS